MKTRNLFMAAALFFASVMMAHAQKYDSEVYVMGGMAYTNMNANESGEGKYGLVLSFENNWRFTKLLGLTAGVGYMNLGAKEDASTSKISLHYINVPVMANFHIANGLSAKIGVQGAYLVANDLESAGTELHTNAHGIFNKFDFGVPVGVSFGIKNMVIELRYYHGLMSPFKSKYRNQVHIDDHDGDNRAFYIMVGYKL